jgi:FkbM family methyltransferase
MKSFETFADLLAVYERIHPGMQFIQVGGHDGVSWDPLRPHIEQGNWTGIIVEPNPDSFAKLTGLYRNSPNITCLQVAIAPEEGKRTLYFIPETEAPVDWAASIGTLVPDRGRIREFEGRIHTIEVQGLPLTRVVQTHHIERLDLLQIDTEGYDYQVIRSLDFDLMRPRIIHWEERHLPHREREECLRFLSNQGYTTFVEPHPNDSTAYLPESFQQSIST